ncbi:glucokinase [Salidesulfovibrio brasiliensis]
MNDTTAKPIFTADIGGTSARFGLFGIESGNPVPLRVETVPVREFPSFAALLREAGEMGFPKSPAECSGAAFAVPGGIHDGRAMLPNVSWDADVRDAGPWSERFQLINDFEAQARACLTPVMNSAQTIFDGTPDPAQTIAVIGAGTGLGHSALVPCGTGRVPMRSEGGHLPFPFFDAEELRYAEFVKKRLGVKVCTGDHIVTGGGLALLHEFLLGEKVTPEQAGTRLDPDGPVAETHARFYGRVCRNWAIATYCLGGMVICGGVAGHNPVLVTHEAFRDAFIGDDEYAEFMETVQVRLNRNGLSGLYGAAQAVLDQAPAP